MPVSIGGTPSPISVPNTLSFRLAALALATLPLLTLVFTDHAGLVDAFAVTRGLIIALGLAWGPLLLKRKLTGRLSGWWNNEANWSVTLLFLFAAAGRAFGEYGLVTIALLVPLYLLNRTAAKPFHKNSVLQLIGVVALSVFLYLHLYSGDYHHLFYTEAAASGVVVLDVPYHASISELWLTQGHPSTGFNGAPPITYHWLSHWLMGGLSRLVGVDSFSFYNLFYPALFLPLFLKVLYLTVNRFYQRNFDGVTFPVLVFVAGTFLLYGLPIETFRAGHPIVSESLLVSTLLILTHALGLDAYAHEPSSKWKLAGLIAYSFLFCLLASFAKLSAGFVWMGGLGLLFLAHVAPPKWWWSIPPFLLIGALVFRFGIPAGRGGFSVPLHERVFNIFPQDGGFLQVAWVPLLLLWWFANPCRRWSIPIPLRLSNLIKLIDKENGPFIFLGAAWIVSMLGAVAASARMSDATYFQLTVLILSLPLFYFAVQRFLLRFSVMATGAIMLAFCALSFLATPKASSGLVKAKIDLTNVREGDANTMTRLAYIKELGKSRSLPNKRNAAIYVSPEQYSWFHAPERNPLFFASLTPAISGIPLVDGVPAKVIRTSTGAYSIGIYLKAGLPEPTESLNIARSRASQLGCNQVLEVKLTNEKAPVFIHHEGAAAGTKEKGK